MNVKRFTARTSREALRLVREALGVDAVVLSTKPGGAGVEVLAMAPDGLRPRSRRARQHDAAAACAAQARRRDAARSGASRTRDQRRAGRAASSMSTLSFQDYVRNRMLKRRQATLAARRCRRAAVPAPARPRASTCASPTPTACLGERSASPAELLPPPRPPHRAARRAAAAEPSVAPSSAWRRPAPGAGAACARRRCRRDVRGLRCRLVDAAAAHATPT